jgi:hypothetical protein
MEADWSVEIGADLPAIVVPWEGFVDLRHNLGLVSAIVEAAATPDLAQTLIRLNQETSPIFTSKCDLWLLSADEIDPLEFDAEREEAEQGIACYIDMIARNEALFASFAAHESWVRSTTDEMRDASVRQARAEFVVRSSTVNECEGYAVTLYVASCGATETAARSIFRTALETAVTITMKQAATMGE